MTEPAQIYTLIPKVALEIGVIGKDSKNQAQGYSFRGIDSVVEGTHDPLLKNGIFPVPEVFDVVQTERPSSRGGVMVCTTLKMKVTFYAPDGSSVSCTTSGEAFDSADKSANKAMSAAFKYAMTLTFLIPTKLDEADFDTPEVEPRSQPARQQQSKPVQQVSEDHPDYGKSEKSRNGFNQWVQPYIANGDISEEKVRSIVRECGGDYREAGRKCNQELQPKNRS